MFQGYIDTSTHFKYVYTVWYLLRYILLWLLLLLLLSANSTSELMVQSESGVRYFANRGDIAVSSGKGRWGIKSLTGFSMLFVGVDGTLMSYCVPDCEVYGEIPSTHRLSISLRDGIVRLSHLDHVRLDMKKGELHTNMVKTVYAKIQAGKLHSILSEGSQLYVQGTKIEGDVMSLTAFELFNPFEQRSTVKHRNEVSSKVHLQVVHSDIRVLGDAIVERQTD